MGIMNSPNFSEASALNLAAFEPRSVVDGPGVRATIWVQGCSILCPGCINADFLPDVPNRRVPAKSLAPHIIADQAIEGVSFSGGEPFEQAAGLAALCDLLRRERPELTFLSYSGYELDALRQMPDPGVARLLAHLDLLVAGPFLLAERGDFKWRGSGNKKIHFLSPRYSPEILRAAGVQTQFHFDAHGGAVHGFGLLGERMKTLKKILEQKGVHLVIGKQNLVAG